MITSRTILGGLHHRYLPVCTENLIGFDDVMESPKLAECGVDLRGCSFAEKLDALDALRDLAGPLRAARAVRDERNPASEGALSMRPSPRRSRLRQNADGAAERILSSGTDSS